MLLSHVVCCCRSFGRQIRLPFITHKLNFLSTTGHQSPAAVLGIETSCDETGVAVVTSDGRILSDVCHSQLQTHLANGGIIPPVARQLHKDHIDNCVRQALEEAKLTAKQMTALAVTIKPGLPLSLIIGKNYAKKLALKHSLPLILIHHMEAHSLTALMEHPELKFPFLTLLISGGHCLIAVAEDIDRFLLLGKSYNDAPGDVLDKIARRLKLKNLGEPFNRISGGAAVELLAKDGDRFKYFTSHYHFPLRSERSCNFNFANFSCRVQEMIKGLEYKYELPPDGVLPEAADIAASSQRFIAEYLVKRLQRAMSYIEWNQMIPEDHPKRLVISGGCACNEYITGVVRNFISTYDYQTIVPKKKLCTDNGVMIAWNGVLKLNREVERPELVLRRAEDIEKVDIEHDAGFGVDLTMRVEKTGIPPEKMNQEWLQVG